MSMDAGGAYVALDLLSFLLAALVAAFFLQSRRLQHEPAFGLLGGAFAVMGIAHLTTAVSSLDLLTDHPALDAVRTTGVFLAGILVLLAYLSRVSPTRHLFPTAGAVLALVTFAAVAAYAAPGLPTGSPYAVFPWLRLLDSLALAFSALLAILDIQARRIGQLVVPAAILLLAFSRYNSGITALTGDITPNPLTYAWRLLALLLLTGVVLRRWPSAPP